MSVIQAEILDQGQLGKMQALLAGIPNGAQRAARSAMSRAVSHLRTNSTKAVRERYDISAGDVKANERVSVKYSHQDGVQAFVTFGGGRIPLFRYGGASPGGPAYDQSKRVPIMVHGQWRLGHPGVAARGHQLKSTAPTLFQHAFVARMGSGHVGIFQRDGDGITEIMGGTVPGMLGSEEVREKLGAETAEKYMERYHHEVVRLLNGWGV